jgi:hypothetical protein
MSTIDIYDIANSKWYQQSTVDGPGQLTQGCAVVAPAEDYSSYNIYYYGGYDGLDPAGGYTDEVWILSLPSFTWTKASSGDSKHARAGHKCVKPYPDQMMVIGGAPPSKSGTANCVSDNIVVMFNLTSCEWMESYDPSIWNSYSVPQMVHAKIGGDVTGGATMTTPSPSGWEDPELASIFATRYETSKLTTYYPYSSEGPSNNTRENVETSGGTPSWIAPVLGVVLGLVFVTAIAVGILLFKKRKLFRKQDASEAGATKENWILSWMRGQTSDKAGTITTEDTPPNDEMDIRGYATHTTNTTPMRQPEMDPGRWEMPDSPLYELIGG